MATGIPNTDLSSWRALVEEMLTDETCEVSSESGFVRSPNYESGYIETMPTGGRTVTIRVRGGGGVVAEPDEVLLERALRIAKSLRRLRDESGSDSPILGAAANLIVDLVGRLDKA